MDLSGGLSQLCEKCGEGDEKRARILEGALGVFLAYGFSRTTMDDIAKASQVSRPALYLLYKNKAEIYRALIGCIFLQIAETTRSVLAGPGSLGQRLELLVQRTMVGTMKSIGASQHGEELTDMKSALGADLLAGWRAEMDEILADAFSKEAKAKGIDLQARGFTALELAQALMDGLDGRKVRLGLEGCTVEAVTPIVRVIVAALRP